MMVSFEKSLLLVAGGIKRRIRGAGVGLWRRVGLSQFIYKINQEDDVGDFLQAFQPFNKTNIKTTLS